MDEGGTDAFDTWGGLRVAVFSGNTLLIDTNDLDFGLVFSLPGNWHSTLAPDLGNVQISRQIAAPTDQNWVRYVDTFHNTSGATRTLFVDWGGNLGSDSGTHVQASSSGDAFITAGDTWAVTQEGLPPAAAGDSPVGYALRSPGDLSYLGPVISSDPVITATWPLSESDDLSHLYTFSLAPGQTRRLAYFVYRGLAENTPGPYDCAFYGGCVTPAIGAEVALADSTLSALAAQPAFCDLGVVERASLVNWPGLALGGCDVFLPVLLR
jgi:amidase